MKQYIGVDIGGTSIKAGIVDECGSVLYNLEYKAYDGGYKIPLWETVKIATEDIYNKYIKEDIKIEGIGFSVTGDIEEQTTEIVGGCGSIPDWENINIKSEIKKLLKNDDIQITAINDANAAALAEMWVGGAKGKTHAIIYTIGTGIGGGVIVDGKILSGSRGFAGNIGHMAIAFDKTKCSCGNSGCFEIMASTKNLLQKVREIGFDVNGKDVFKLANENAEVQKIVEEFFVYHGVAIASLIHIFNPEAIIIGGGISGEGEWLLEKIKAEVEKRTIPHFFKGVEFTTAKLKNMAGIVGGVKNLIDHIGAK